MFTCSKNLAAKSLKVIPEKKTVSDKMIGDYWMNKKESKESS